MDDSSTNSLPVRAVGPDIFVAPQISPQHVAEAARLGFRSIINNRPDFEHGPDQPSAASIEAAAREAGLEYRFLPVSGAYQSPEDVATFATLLAELPRPILAFCRSGARSTRLYMLATGPK